MQIALANARLGHDLTYALVQNEMEFVSLRYEGRVSKQPDRLLGERQDQITCLKDESTREFIWIIVSSTGIELEVVVFTDIPESAEHILATFHVSGTFEGIPLLY